MDGIRKEAVPQVLYFLFFVRIVCADRMCNQRDLEKRIFYAVTTAKGVNGMKVGFIGAGKVGFSLGKYFKEHNVIVTGYYSKSPESAKSAADFTNTKAYDTMEMLLRESDTLFITVPDRHIGEVWDCIKNLDIKNKNICHCSGSIASTAFFDGEKLGASVYSVHPLYAISSKYESYQELQNAYFTLEGSQNHMKEMITFLQQAGCRVITITPENKSLYHCGAVVVSNLVVGLYAMGVHMLESCGFEKEDAQNALVPLFLGNAQSVAEKGAVAALTGPVERADVATIEKHLQSIKNVSDLKSKEEFSQIYLLLSEQLLAIAGEKHPDRDYTKVAEVIQNEKHSFNI